MTVKEKRKSLPESYKVVADCIRVGKENATLLSDIMIIAQIQDRRQAYIIIERLITKYGYPIVASRQGKKGYYYSANQSEFEEASRTFKNSIDSMKKRYLALIDNQKNYETTKGVAPMKQAIDKEIIEKINNASDTVQEIAEYENASVEDTVVLIAIEYAEEYLIKLKKGHK